MNEPKKEVSFLYEKSKNAITFPCNGFIGGATSDNSIVVHLYEEFASVPHNSNFKVDSNGGLNLGSEQSVKRADVTREIQATVSFTPEAAISVGQTLLELGKNLITQRNNRPPQQ